MKTLTYTPYEGAGSIKFGMSREGASEILGPPNSTTTTSMGEVEDDWGLITLRYDVDSETVAEIAFHPNSGIEFEGKQLYNEDELTSFLSSKDDSPYECFGFVVFLEIGIAITGFHDGDVGERAITAFKKGRWDSMRNSFQAFHNK